MSGGNLTINQEKQLRALRDQMPYHIRVVEEKPDPKIDYLPKQENYEELGRVCAMYRRLKQRHDKEATELRQALLAQMDGLLKDLGLA
jgi:hypothetical protein